MKKVPRFHPAPLRLMAYFDAELTPRREARVHRHVSGCERCVNVLVTYGRIGLMLQGLGMIAERRPEPVSVLARPARTLRAAAVSLLVLAVGSAALITGGTSSVGSRRAAGPGPGPGLESIVGAPTLPVEGDHLQPKRSGSPRRQIADEAGKGAARAVAIAAPVRTEAARPAAGEPDRATAEITEEPLRAEAPQGPVVAGPVAGVTAAPVGLVRPASGPSAELARQAAIVFASGLTGAVTEEVSDDPLDALDRLGQAGVRLAVLPVWPAGVSADDVAAVASAHGMTVLTGGSRARPGVVAIRPGPEIEASVMADRLAEHGSSPIVFVGADPDDQTFAWALERELRARGSGASVVPDDLCPTRLAVSRREPVVLATGAAKSESCLAATAGRSGPVVVRADAVVALATAPTRTLFVSPLAFDQSEEQLSVAKETLVLTRLLAAVVRRATLSEPDDPAAGLPGVRLDADGVFPAVDLAQAPRPVVAGTVLEITDAA